MKVNLKKTILFTMACTAYSTSNVKANIPYVDAATDLISVAADAVNIVTLDSTDVETQKLAAFANILARLLKGVHSCTKIQTTPNKDDEKTTILSNTTYPFNAIFSRTPKATPSISETFASLGVDGLSAFLGDIPTLTKSKQLALYNKNVHRQQRLAAVKWSQSAWLLFNTLLKASAHYQGYKSENTTEVNEKASRLHTALTLRILAFWSEIARRYSFYKARFNHLDEWTEENTPGESVKFLLPHAYTVPSEK